MIRLLVSVIWIPDRKTQPDNNPELGSVLAVGFVVPCSKGEELYASTLETPAGASVYSIRLQVV